MTFDITSGLHHSARAADLEIRVRLQQQLGLTEEPDAEFDEFATALAEAAGVPYAFVNVIGPRRQYFKGLHTPSGRGELPAVGRSMSLEDGYCPGLITRRGKALVIADVYEAPRFAGNPVVDHVGIRTYAGAPLIHPETGIFLGSVCFVGTEPRGEELDSVSLALVKSCRNEVTDSLAKRERGRHTPR